MCEARDLFDATISLFPQTSRRLASGAQSVLQPCFEKGIVKLQNADACSMSIAEIVATEMLKVGDNSILIEETGVDISFVERALKRQRLSASNVSGGLIESGFIIPTSNICEQLFSFAGFVFNDRRRGLSTVNFEAQVFLNLYSYFSNQSDVNKVVHSA